MTPQDYSDGRKLLEANRSLTMPNCPKTKRTQPRVSFGPTCPTVKENEKCRK